MKKSLLLLFAGLSLTANAQETQIPNSDFEADWVKCIPWTSNNNNKTQGDSPSAIGEPGWHVSNTVGAGGTGATSVVAKKDGSAYMFNASSVGQNIPGYLTLGTPWSTAKVRFTTPSDKDGGSFGGYAFSVKPDAINFDYKCVKSEKSDIAASVIAYLWKGTYTQAAVPGHITYSIISPANPTTVDMVDRDRNILDMETAKGGAVSKTADAARIAKIQHNFTEDQEEFTNFTLDFTYETDDTPEKINIIFAAGDYFSSSPVDGVSLTVDNVKLIYRSQLISLSYNGEAVADFSKDTYNYSVADYYTPDCLAYTTNGHNATIEENYDEKTGVATITVSNVDADEDGDTQHVYTVTFKRKLTISGETTYDSTTEGTFDAVVLNRSFVKGWNTLCLPFNISAEELSEDAAAEEFNSYDAESGLRFTKVSGDLQARKPYLVWLPEAVDGFTFANKTIEAGAPDSVTFEGVTFAGNYAAAFPLEGLYTAVLAEATTGTLAEADASATLDATSAAFTLTEEAATGSLDITLEECGAATGIDAAASAAASSAAAVYDLSGRRVQTAAKGLYIIDGRKMIVK